MMKRALILAALCAASATHAVGVSPAVLAAGAASRAHVAATRSQSATQSPATGLCFWQVPGKMQWVNVGHLAWYDVRPNRNGVSHTFRAKVVGLDALEIELPAGTPSIQEIPNAIAQRIAECAAGG